jgi:hypothetical protein
VPLAKLREAPELAILGRESMSVVAFDLVWVSVWGTLLSCSYSSAGDLRSAQKLADFLHHCALDHSCVRPDDLIGAFTRAVPDGVHV